MASTLRVLSLISQEVSAEAARTATERRPNFIASLDLGFLRGKEGGRGGGNRLERNFEGIVGNLVREYRG